MGKLLGGIGQIHLARGEPAKAIAPLERAVAILSSPGGEEQEAEIEFTLAQARWAVGDHAAAVGLATDARRLYAGGPPKTRRRVDEVSAWLARHR